MNGFLFTCEENNQKFFLEDLQSYFNCRYRLNGALKINIGHHTYQKEAVVEEIDVIINLIQREWFLFQTICLNDIILPYKEMLYGRELINKFFVAIKESLQICECPLRKDKYKQKVFEQIKCLFNSIIQVANMQNAFVVKLSSWKENDTKNPIYQYFHIFLEMQYHLLLLSYICKSSDLVVNELIENIISNFIHLSKRNYQRQTGQVFVCSCIKNFWLILQFYLEKTNDIDYFWKVFNKKLEHEDNTFSLWILTHISELQLINEFCHVEGNTCSRIRPNYELLQNKLKALLGNADSDMLLIIFNIIYPLLTNYWLKHARVDIYQTIWDFYSKRLNISKKNYSNLNALDLNTSVNNIISSEHCTEDFEKFLSILICHLREHPTHWGKMKGRIYSQLGPQKLKDLNSIGIVHVMLLFSSLSSLNYEELLKKILNFLEGLSQEKRNDPLIWNIYIAFIIEQVKRGYTVETTAPILLSWIQEASLDHKNFHLIKLFISNVENILNFSVHMDLHQWLFINTWLTKYVSSCYYADMTAALEMLLFTLQKTENPDSWCFWMQRFKEYVYPVLKHLSHAHNAPEIIGKIAGKLYFLIPQLSMDIFNYFTSDNTPPQVALSFLTLILSEYPSTCILNSQQEASVIQCWIKISLLSTESYSGLKKAVTRLDTFPMHLKSHINSSDNPIQAFIEYLGSDIKTHIQSNAINKLCELCFGNIDKWLPQYLIHPNNESTISRIYIYLALAFLHCGPLLYSRNRSSSPLTKLMQCLLFPSDFLIGKPLHEYVLNSIKKTWHLFYEALINLKTDSDMYVERSLKDMITKYMPHFPTNDSPIVKCLEKETTADVILEKICNSYFKHPVKESDNNLLKVIKILSDTVQSTTSISLLRRIVIKTLCGLFELVIFHPQRSLAINLIKIITQSSLYSHVRTEFCTNIVSTTERHLSFNATNYFQMMYILAKFVPSDVKDVLEKISQHVSNVERLRGVGYDINLRSQLEKLEYLIKTT